MSVGIISRIMEIDIPYYSEWLEYYDKLGVDSFYLIIYDRKNLDLKNLLKYYPEHKIKGISYINHNQFKNNNANLVLKMNLFNITDDYLLNVDSDEFLYLDGLNIKDFISKYNDFNYFRFNWLMVPSKNDYNESLNEIFNNPSQKKYFLTQYKSMIKRSEIKKYSITPHDFECDSKLIKEFKEFNKFYIIHFSFRGKCDAYLKLKNQLLGDSTETNIKNILDYSKELKGFQIPDRFLVFIGETINKNENVNISYNLNLDSKTDLDFIKNMITGTS